MQIVATYSPLFEGQVGHLNGDGVRLSSAETIASLPQCYSGFPEEERMLKLKASSLKPGLVAGTHL